jgi:hypothetical protein
MSRTARWMHGVVLAAAAVAGCEAVPTLVFPAADASVAVPDDATALGDGASDGGAASDAIADAGDADLAEASCPARPPAGATACCGSLPCGGDCDARCSECLTKCSALGSVCCAGSSVTCHNAGFLCK